LRGLSSTCSTAPQHFLSSIHPTITKLLTARQASQLDQSIGVVGYKLFARTVECDAPSRSQIISQSRLSISDIGRAPRCQRQTHARRTHANAQS